MSPSGTRRERRHRGLRSVYVWHRWLGVASAVIVLMLAMTGILLNHSHDLGFDRKFVGARWLLDGYGVRGGAPDLGYRAGGHWVSASDGQLFLDAQAVAAFDDSLRASLECAGMLVAAGSHTLLLLTPRGEPVERIGREGLPGDIRFAACDGNDIIVDTAHSRFRSSTDLVRWRPYSVKTPLRAPRGEPLPGKMAGDIADSSRAHSLTWERVLADLHSGRIFGRLGTLAMDIAAAGFMVLALSGLWLWARYLRAKRQRHHRTH